MRKKLLELEKRASKKAMRYLLNLTVVVWVFG